jgi:autotransporter-associated beta strand protein
MKFKNQLLAVVVLAGLCALPVHAGTYNWNTTSGDWDTGTPNWTGDSTTWSDGGGNDAFFTNTASVATVTLVGPRIAGAVKVGNSGNNARYTFSNGTGGSLSAASFVAQGNGNNELGVGATVLSNLTLTTTGDLLHGRWDLTIKGSSTVSVGGKIGGSTAPDWGRLTIQDTAAVTAASGVDFYAPVTLILLNGGSLTTPVIRAQDGQWSGVDVHLTFNGGLVIASASTNNFLQINGSGRAWVKTGGAKIDTGANNITISSKLIHDTTGSAIDGGLTKLGAGTLTLSGTNTYTGPTTVSNGTLAVTSTNVLPSDTDVSIASGASMTLNFTGTNTVRTVTLDGVPQSLGTWGSPSSGAANTNSQFTGTGVLLASRLKPVSWNTGSGVWDLTTPNWTGGATTWADVYDAIFDNGSGYTITNSGTRSANSVFAGNEGQNYSWTFYGGTLNVAGNFIYQGSSANGQTYGSNPTLTLTNTTLSVGGDLEFGRANLTICNATVNVNRLTTSYGTGTEGTWGNVTINSGATVHATNGVDILSAVTFNLNLNGGTLYTPFLHVSDREGVGQDAWLTFNGGTVVATADTNAFITTYNTVGGANNVFISNGGAIINTFDGTTAHSITIGVNLTNTTGQAGSLTKLGAGTLTLSGANTYRGGTTVSNGTLLVNGSVTGTVTVASGGTLGGTGTIKGTVTNSGAITAADTNSIGTLTVTNLVMNQGSTYLWNYNSTSQDVINVTGLLTLPTVATVTVSQVSGTLSGTPVLFTFGSCSASGNLTQWVVNGLSGKSVLVDPATKQVRLVSPTGMMLEVY